MLDEAALEVKVIQYVATCDALHMLKFQRFY